MKENKTANVPKGLVNTNHIQQDEAVHEENENPAEEKKVINYVCENQFKTKMSELIKHECGVAMIRLLKPLSYYQEKYGTTLYGINQLNVMMQKQKNRGQDGAGIATIKLNMPPGSRYVSRKRSIDKEPIDSIFKNVYKYYKDSRRVL